MRLTRKGSSSMGSRARGFGYLPCSADGVKTSGLFPKSRHPFGLTKLLLINSSRRGPNYLKISQNSARSCQNTPHPRKKRSIDFTKLPPPPPTHTHTHRGQCLSRLERSMVHWTILAPGSKTDLGLLIIKAGAQN